MRRSTESSNKASSSIFSIHGDGLFSERSSTGVKNVGKFVNIQGNLPKSDAHTLSLGGNDGILCLGAT